MVAAQTRIFSRLYEYCEKRGEPVPDRTEGRWIAGTQADTRFFRDATCAQFFLVSPRRVLVRMDHESRTYLATVGLGAGAAPNGFVEDDLSAGQFSVILAETAVAPTANSLTISNAIGGANKSHEGYDGHPLDIIKPLFADSRVYVSDALDQGETWRTFYEVCVEAAFASETWIERDLADHLIHLTRLSSVGLPFQTLCRSVFDTDPASLFLALYRCLEALYAFQSAKKLMNALGVQMQWALVARVVEAELGWRPKEEDSLQTLIAMAEEPDVEAVFENLGVSPPVEANASLRDAAAKRIYKLRNVLVHYRPIHHAEEHSSVSWNDLCCTLCRIIGSVYATVHSPDD
jgi:hypothetical protein